MTTRCLPVERGLFLYKGTAENKSRARKHSTKQAQRLPANHTTVPDPRPPHRHQKASLVCPSFHCCCAIYYINIANTFLSNMASALDAHARPPEPLRHRYKQCQKASLSTIGTDHHIFDVQRQSLGGCILSSSALPDDIHEVIRRFLPSTSSPINTTRPDVYEHPSVPGISFLHTMLPL